MIDESDVKKLIEQDPKQIAEIMGAKDFEEKMHLMRQMLGKNNLDSMFSKFMKNQDNSRERLMKKHLENVARAKNNQKTQTPEDIDSLS